MKKSTLLLQFPLSFSSLSFKSDNLALKSLLKKISNLVINGGTPEDYEVVYHSIPPKKINLREAFIAKISRKARQENWLVDRIEEVMKRLD